LLPQLPRFVANVRQIVQRSVRRAGKQRPQCGKCARRSGFI